MTTKQTIMQGARDVFRSKGYAAARMQEIADHCGVNKALLHYHFGNKEALFQAVLREAFQELIATVFRSLSSELPLREKIESTAQVYMDRVIADPYLPLFVLNEINRDPDFIRENITTAGGPPEVFFRQVYEANVSGELFPVDPFDIIADLLGLSVIAILARPMLQSVSRRSDEEYQHFLQARKAHVTSLLLNGLFRPSH